MAVKAGTRDIQVTIVETKAQMQEIMSEKGPWLVYFHDGRAQIRLPQSEEDDKESAWFAKLSAVWEDVMEGRVPWAARSKMFVKFASADTRALSDDGASELFDSEFSSMPTGTRLIARGRFHGVTPAHMESRKGMHRVIEWLDAKLVMLKQKEEL